MGYRLDRTYVLEFQGDMDGAEIKIRKTTAAVAKQLRELEGRGTPEAYSSLLAGHIVSWNVEDENGKPAPHATGLEVMEALEIPEIVAVIRAWYQAATGVTAPLDARSIPSGLALEESIPMETEPPQS